jgi:cytoskeletal protein RodZ
MLTRWNGLACARPFFLQAFGEYSPSPCKHKQVHTTMDQLIPWLSLTLAVLALLGMGAMFWYMRRQQASQAREIEQTYFDLQQSQLSALQRDVKALLARLEKLEQVATTNHASSALTPTGAAVPGTTPYNQAIELARQGMPAAEVATRCGISRSEAELIVALYRRARS